jgi:hypothetical protein
MWIFEMLRKSISLKIIPDDDILMLLIQKPERQMRLKNQETS